MTPVKILQITNITHDVRGFTLEKPDGYKFVPGQATEVAINKPDWEEKKHPFTFTSLEEDKILEFTIKTYPVADNPDHSGMTEKLRSLQPGDELLLDNSWGTINYKNKGVFIAGGAGITPFIAILRRLFKDGELAGNKLVFSNKTEADIILMQELKYMFADNPQDLVLTLTQEQNSDYASGRVDKEFLQKHIDKFDQDFYVCGPKAMVADLKETLADLGAETQNIVFEE